MPTKMNFIVPSSEDEVIISNNIVTINGAEYDMGANDILLVPDEGESSVDLSNYVTLDGDQIISGNKTFSSNIRFGNNVTDATTPPVIVNSTYGHIALGEVDLDSYATKLTFYERGMTTDYLGRYIKYPYENFRLNLPEVEFNKTHTIATQEWVSAQGFGGGNAPAWHDTPPTDKLPLMVGVFSSDPTMRYMAGSMPIEETGLNSGEWSDTFQIQMTDSQFTGKEFGFVKIDVNVNFGTYTSDDGLSHPIIISASADEGNTYWYVYTQISSTEWDWQVSEYATGEFFKVAFLY